MQTQAAPCLRIITFDTSMSADETMEAIEENERLQEQMLLSGMSAVVTDIKKKDL